MGFYAGFPLWEHAVQSYWAKYRDKMGFRIKEDMYVYAYDETGNKLLDKIPLWGFLAPYNDWDPIYKKIVTYVTGNKVLDIGCGQGRIALYLQEKGFDVRGIDLSPASIEICKERGFTNCEVADFNNFQTTEKYDTLLLMGSVIGEISQRVELFKGIVPKIMGLLKPNGRIVATMSYPRWTERTMNLMGVSVHYQRYLFKYMDQWAAGAFIQYHLAPHDLEKLFGNLVRFIALYDGIPDEIGWNPYNQGYSFCLEAK